jgi:hypothetical protein
MKLIRRGLAIIWRFLVVFVGIWCVAGFVDRFVAGMGGGHHIPAPIPHQWLVAAAFVSLLLASVWYHSGIGKPARPQP